MVIVPHGDDEILGFYGVIKNNVEQNNYICVAFVMGPKNLTNNRNTHQFYTIEKVRQKLKYNEVLYLDKFNEHNIHANKLELITEIEQLIVKNNIDSVYIKNNSKYVFIQNTFIVIPVYFLFSANLFSRKGVVIV